MKDSLRLIIFAAIMGLCVSYVLWGKRPQAPSTNPTEPQHPDPQKPPEKNAKTSKLILKPAVQNLKLVDPDTTHQVVFQIHNPTDHPIEIKYISPGCGCVNAQMDVNTIPANSFSNLTTKYTARRSKNAVRVPIKIHTSEDGAPYLTAYIEAEIYHEIIVEPAVVNFETMPSGETKSKTFTVRHAKGLNFKLLGVNSSKSYLTFKWEPEIKGVLSAYRVTATCVAPNQPVTHKETCAIITNLKSTASKLIPIDMLVSVRGALSVSPPSLVGRYKADGTISQPLQFTLKRFTPGAAIKVTGIKESRSKKISYTTKVDGEKLLVTITFKHPQPTDRASTGALLIQTEKDYTRFPLTVPYRITPALPNALRPEKAMTKEPKAIPSDAQKIKAKSAK